MYIFDSTNLHIFVTKMNRKFVIFLNRGTAAFAPPYSIVIPELTSALFLFENETNLRYVPDLPAYLLCV